MILIRNFINISTNILYKANRLLKILLILVYLKQNKMKKNIIIATVLAIFVFAACSKKTNPSKTTETAVVTEAAPAKPAATSYSSAVQSLVQAKCSPCHIPSKGGNKLNIENYEIAKKNIADIIARVEKNPNEMGFMPMRNAKLSEEEIGVFKKWLADGLLEK